MPPPLVPKSQPACAGDAAIPMARAAPGSREDTSVPEPFESHMANKPQDNKVSSLPVVAILAWLLPGLGHWWIGERRRALIFFVVTTVTFWGGIAVGGVRSAVTPKENGLWIAAQFCMGPQAMAALRCSHQLAQRPDAERFKAPWPASNIGVVYAGVAGLLNLLIILDALARVEARQSTVSARSPPRTKKGGAP